MIATRWFNDLADEANSRLAAGRVALAMGVPFHRLRYIISREGQSSNRPLKPGPAGREALQARKVAARLQEQTRQQARGLHNFNEVQS